ncbi:stabilizer of axonemal microtubules 2-like [Diprion similis]|uniref:stabilizer of axonemal microtubules 2-like n=1 Tax=Diprion similis TaxID=362088 RepID=UPI001EF907C7|nr:stabilizer of axonemal microtubules 2-like [Diprion similis]
MEVVELCPNKRAYRAQVRPTTCPCNMKCTKRYVQPAREKSYAPEKVYCPPTKPIDANTTYHLSYLNVDKAAARHAKTQSFKPVHSLDRAMGKISDETTNRLSFRANWGITRAKAFTPSRRTQSGQGPMQCITTARHDYVPKYVPRMDLFVPCNNIRTSKGVLDDKTTAALSYMNPGPVEPVVNYKPEGQYCPPEKSIEKYTTQKLSYQPFRVPRKEIYPWKLKQAYKYKFLDYFHLIVETILSYYKNQSLLQPLKFKILCKRPPDATMEGATTYSKSYLQNENLAREQPFKPANDSTIFPGGAQFAGKTIYGESFLPCDIERPVPIRPCSNIARSNQKMSGDTTNKLSYQPVSVEKRGLIIPSRRNMMGDGPMQCLTTNRHDFVPKLVPRPDLVIPCDNIRSSDQPLEGRTTATLSYMDPGPIEPVTSYKPSSQYCKPAAKIDGETINKLSYQPWIPGPKMDLPWARKTQYKPPTTKMGDDTVYHQSYPAPGYYIEDCVLDECPCPPESQEDCGPDSL